MSTELTIHVSRFGNDATVHFPPVDRKQQRAVNLTLTSTSLFKSKWRIEELEGDDTRAFTFTPTPGALLPHNAETVEVVFCPCEQSIEDLFSSFYLLKTVAEEEDEESCCRLVLVGRRRMSDLTNVSMNADKTESNAHAKSLTVVEMTGTNLSADASATMKQLSADASNTTTNASSLTVLPMTSVLTETMSANKSDSLIKIKDVQFDNTAPISAFKWIQN